MDDRRGHRGRCLGGQWRAHCNHHANCERVESIAFHKPFSLSWRPKWSACVASISRRVTCTTGPYVAERPARPPSLLGRRRVRVRLCLCRALALANNLTSIGTGFDDVSTRGVGPRFRSGFRIRFGVRLGVSRGALLCRRRVDRWSGRCWRGRDGLRISGRGCRRRGCWLRWRCCRRSGALRGERRRQYNRRAAAKRNQDASCHPIPPFYACCRLRNVGGAVRRIGLRRPAIRERRTVPAWNADDAAERSG